MIEGARVIIRPPGGIAALIEGGGSGGIDGVGLWYTQI